MTNTYVAYTSEAKSESDMAKTVDIGDVKARDLDIYTKVVSPENSKS